jgi:serine/threonine protein kinase
VAPCNILFDSKWHPVLSVYGLSRLSKHGGLDDEKSQTAGLHDSIRRWMAPEVLASERQYSFASDVWSLGVVLWQVLTWESTPYPEEPELQSVVSGLIRRRLDLRASLPTEHEWDTLRGLVRL